MLIKSAQAEQGFIISDSFKKAWEVFKKDWILVYAVQLLPIAIAIVYTVILDKVEQESIFALLYSLL